MHHVLRQVSRNVSVAKMYKVDPVPLLGGIVMSPARKLFLVTDTSVNASATTESADLALAQEKELARVVKQVNTGILSSSSSLWNN